MRLAPSSSPEQWQLVEDLFHRASQMPAVERAAFLDQACGSNSSIRAEVESLLKSSEESGAFLISAVQGVAASYLTDRAVPKLATGTCIDAYRVLGVLGCGGMGCVYLAEDTKLKRKVALKVLSEPSTADPQALRRFQREAETLSALNQANLLTVFDFCQSGHGSYLVTEYVEGETLRSILKGGPMTPARAVDIALQVAMALRAAHDAGVAHRDIKPENIMVRADGGVKVLDFGIAKLVDVAPVSGRQTTQLMSTMSKGVLGTPRYMSPEQARGLVVDHRTDLFSLGAVLYEMLAGRSAFQGETHGDLVADILRSKPTPLVRIAPGVSKELSHIVERALHKDRDKRYQDAAELIVDLQKCRRSEAAIAAHKMNVSVWAVAAVLALMTVAAVILMRSAFLPVKAGRPRAIAVLPFRNLDPSTDTNFLSYSLAEEVTAKLGYLKALTVRPASAGRRYQGGTTDTEKAAATLNADLVLLGTYRKTGDDLQISVRLMGVTPTAVLWQDSLRVPYGRLMTVHQRVAQLVISGLALQVGPDEVTRMRPEPKVDARAYEYFLRGVDLYAASNFQGAIEMLEKAAAMAPDYAPTWAQLGRAYTTHASLQFGGRDDYRRAENAYQRAIAADPFSPEPRVYMANLFTDTGRVEEAVPLLRVALQSSPNDAEAHWELGYAFRYGGMLKESATECELARHLDPEVKINSATLNTYLYLGEYEKFVKSAPWNDSALLVFYHGFGLFHLRRLAEAAQDLDRAYELAPDLIQAQVGKALSFGITRQPEAGLKQLRQTEQKMRERGVTDPEAIYKIAQVYAVLGDRRDSLMLLQRSIAGGFFPYDYMTRDPLLRDLHDSETFQNWMGRARERQEQFRRRFLEVAQEDANALRPLAEAH